MMIGPYLDANVFIDLMEGEESVSRPLQHLFLQLRDKKTSAVTSELTLAEVLVKARKNGGALLHRRYVELLVFSGRVDLRPVSRSLMYSVAEYRGLTGAKIPDSVHVVTAIERGCKIFVTRDNRIRFPAGLVRLQSDEPQLNEWIERGLA
jgi:predicted nucleic acid-binding protein